MQVLVPIQQGMAKCDGQKKRCQKCLHHTLLTNIVLLIESGSEVGYVFTLELEQLLDNKIENE